MLLDATGQLATKREIKVRDAKIAKFAAYADDVFRQLALTVICVKCLETPKMANHRSDAQWKMECSCTVRVLKNPDVQ